MLFSMPPAGMFDTGFAGCRVYCSVTYNLIESFQSCDWARKLVIRSNIVTALITSRNVYDFFWLFAYCNIAVQRLITGCV